MKLIEDFIFMTIVYNLEFLLIYFITYVIKTQN